MPTTARVARIHEYGPPEALRFEDIVVGEPGDDEALIRNTVIGLNFVDVYCRRGSGGTISGGTPPSSPEARDRNQRTQIVPVDLVLHFCAPCCDF